MYQRISAVFPSPSLLSAFLPMKLIIGLGNPGKRYEKTRHNVGFMILDALHNALQPYEISRWELSKKFNSYIAGCTKKSKKILLAKPATFMNHSGHAASLIAQYYKITPDQITVVHDDKDIPLGEVKSQTDRGHAGHNGVKSIIECLGTKKIPRYRIGIANTGKKNADTAEFVLGKFSLLERRYLKKIIDETVQQILQKLD